MGSYRVSRLALLALAVAALGGCARDVTSPGGATTAPRLSATSAGNAYIVLFKANAIPDDFAARVGGLGGTVTFTHAGAGLAVVAGLTDATAATLATAKDVQEVDPDVVFTLDPPVATAEAFVADAVQSQTNPTTAGRYAWQWNMRAIRAPAAWAAGKLGSSDVTVAILDTGIDYDAPDLNGLVDLSISKSFIASDDALTATYFPTRNAVSDYHGHGTNVATQVSSKAAALAGVTSKTKLMAVKVLGRTGSSAGGSVVAGLLWAADHGADVANLSLGGMFTKIAFGRYIGYLNRVFDYANRKGMLIVVAAGNEGTDLDHSMYVDTAVRNGPVPVVNTYCEAQHVLCVSSVGPAVASQVANGSDTFSYYSNFGRSAIGVAAPGGNADAANNFTVSAWPWGNDIASWVWSYCTKTRIAGLTSGGAPILTSCVAGNRLTGYIGTSQATPHVAGLAALLVDQLGHKKPSQIKAAILKSADDLGQPGTDPFYGSGRINVAKALGL